ncbi:MAG TPA: CvpA family protein [Bryobacteraceae bacterium]|nr:CvpA family protein [Bryobacteraceae bacterium]
MSFNWLDWVLIAILLYFTVTSAMRGFTRDIIGLAASVFALILAMWFYGSAGYYVGRWVASERTASLIGFIAIVFGVLLAGRLLAWIINRFLRTVGLSFFDRFLGALFGLVKGFIVSVALLTAYMAFGPVFDKTAGNQSGAAQSPVLHSEIAPWLLEASRVLVAMAPMELKSSFRKQYDGARSLLKKDHF